VFPVYWVCLFLLTLMLVVHSIVAYRQYRKEREEAKLPRQRSRTLVQAPFQGSYCFCLANITYNDIVHFFSILGILCGIGYVFDSVLPYHQFKHKSCELDSVAGAIFFAYHKFCIYTCLVVRLQLSFNGSSYAYSSIVTNIFHIFNVSTLIIFATVIEIKTIQKKELPLLVMVVIYVLLLIHGGDLH